MIKEYYKHPQLGWGWHAPATTTTPTHTMRIEFDSAEIKCLLAELNATLEDLRLARAANNAWHTDVGRILRMTGPYIRNTSRQEKIARLERLLADCPCRMGQCPGSLRKD
jgi:hypothetical protein